MPKYRAYQMDKEGRVLGLPDIITCDDDETAIKKAEPLGNGNQVEVWHGDRLVARLPKRAD
jgi:hypothetical protein